MDKKLKYPVSMLFGFTALMSTAMASSAMLIEAEDYTGNQISGTHGWTEANAGSAMQLLPDIGIRLGTAADVNTTTDARLDYSIDFPAAGTYYVSLLAGAPQGDASGGSDSVHVGLNGGITAEKLETPGDSFNWHNTAGTGGRAVITVPSAGMHTFNIFMREDGTVVDKIFLSQDVNEAPPTIEDEPAPGEVELLNDPLDGSTIGTIVGNVAFQSGGGIRSTGGKIIFDAGQQITSGYFEATMRGYTVPQTGTAKSHPLSGWEFNDGNNAFNQKAPRVGSFWNWRIGTNYEVLKTLAASDSIDTRHEARAGEADQINGKTHVARIEWNAGLITFKIDGAVIWSHQFDRMSIRYFTIGRDDSYTKLTIDPPIISNVRVVDASATGSADTSPPSVPAGLTADAPSETVVDLTWNAATDAEGSIDSYRIYRNGVPIATTSTTNYSDTGLTAGTSYTYSVSAIDDSGNESSTSTAVSVTTPGGAVDETPPNVPQNVSANNVTVSSVDLAWQASVDPEGSPVSYDIYRGQDFIATVSGLGYTDTSVSAGATYDYTVVAVDGEGNASNPSAAVTVTIPNVADDTDPAAPTNLQGSATSDTQVSLSWDAATDNVGVVGYRVYRDGGGSPIADVAGTSYVDTGLTAATAYQYGVSAYDAAGNESAQAGPITVTTEDAPEPGTGKLIEAENYTSLNAGDPHAWELTADGTAMIVLPDARVRLGTAADVDDTTARMDYAVYFEAAGVYYVSVNGYGPSEGNSGLSDSVHIGLNGTVTAEKVELPGTSPAWYNQDGSGARAIVTVPAAGTHTLNVYMREDGTTVDKLFLSQDPNEDPSGATASDDTTPPTAPLNLFGIALSSSEVSLTWDAATDAEGNVVSYRVFRDGVDIVTVTDPAYNDTGLSGDSTYSYTVSAIDDSANESGQSTAFAVTTPSGADTTPPTVPQNLSATVTGPSTVDLNWDVANDAEGSIVNYRVYRDGSLIATVAETSYADSGLSAATSYTYTVAAIDESSNESAQSDAVSATTEATADITPPDVPANLQGSADSESAISLSWDAATDSESAVVAYHLYRDGSEIAVLAATSYTDTGLLAETSYSYSVSAEDAAGNESAASATVSVTTDVAPEPGSGKLIEAENYTSLNAGDPHAWELTADGSAMIVLPDARVRLGTAADVDDTTARMDYAVYFDTAGVYYVSVNGHGPSEGNTGLSDSVHVGLNGTVTAEKMELPATTPTWFNEDGSGARAIITVPSAGTHTVNIFMREDGTTVDKFFLSQDPNDDPAQATGSDDTTPPPAPQNLFGSALNSSEVSLSWDAAVDGEGAVVSYRVYRGGSVVATVSETVYTDTGLAGDTTYAYTVSAIDDSGNEGAQSAEFAVTTPVAADTNAPGIPQNLSANATSPTNVDLSWDASTDAEGSPVSYSVYRDGGLLATVTTTTYSDSTAAAESSYAYTVTALDESNNESAPSTAANVTTPALPDTNPPSIPQNLTAANVTATGVDLSWDAATDDEGSAITYLVLRDGSQVGSTAATTYTDSGLTGATSYDYSVIAEDAAGNPSLASAVVTVTTESAADINAPTVPANVAGTGESDSTISLTWDASEDFEGEVSGYRIYRDLQEPFIAEVSTTGYIDNGLSASTAYDYEVSAFDDSGNESAKSVVITVSTQAPPADETPPSTPLNVMAIAMTSNSIDVSWDASTDDDSGVQSYRVFRDGVDVGLVATNSFSDSGLDPDQTYSYTVTAIDVAGNESAQSAAASATTLVEQDLTPPSVPANLTVTSDTPTTATLTWDASSDEDGSVSGYRVYRDGSFVIEVASTGFIDNGLTEGTQYSYAVSAIDDSGNESAQSATVDVTTSVADSTPPNVPAGLTATPTSTTSISLNWTASTDDGVVAGYDVFRDGAPLATVSTPGYSDSGLEPDTTYSYTVSAFDDSLNTSAQSAPVTATTDAESGGFTEVNIDFSSGDTSAWTFVKDSGENQDVTWVIENGVLKQTGYVTKNLGSVYFQSYRFGTYAALNGYSDLADYRFEVDITPRRDGIERAPYDSSDQGIMFRYTDADNYYRLSVNTRKSFTRLEKRVGGTFETLATNDQGYTEDQTMQLAVVVSGPIIRVERDGEALFTVYDTDLPAGSIALYSQDSVEFDNVALTNIPDTPILTAGFPSAYSVTPDTTVQATASVINAPAGSYVEFDFAGSNCSTAVESPVGSGFYTADCGSFAAFDYDTPQMGLGAFLYSAADLLLLSDYNDVIGIGGIEYIAAGDSITEGSFDLYEPDNRSADGRIVGRQGYIAPLADLLTAATSGPVMIHNAGVGGDNTGAVKNRINSMMDRHPNSTRVLMMAGTNDASGATPKPTTYFTGNMQDIINRITNRGMEAWVARMPPSLPYEDYLTKNVQKALYNAEIPNFTGVTVGPDFWSFFYDNNGTSDTSDDYDRWSLFFDELHPNALGQQIMAAMWYNTLTGGNEQPFYLDRLCNRVDSPACDDTSPTTHKQDLLWTAYPLLYTDAYYEVTAAPSYLDEGVWIKTNDAEAGSTLADYLYFEVDRAVQVYVAYDAGATSVPDWLATNFTNTGDFIDTDHPSAPQLAVWEATFSAGSVSLGANMATGAAGADANYVVIVKP